MAIASTEDLALDTWKNCSVTNQSLKGSNKHAYFLFCIRYRSYRVPTTVIPLQDCHVFQLKLYAFVG